MSDEQNILEKEISSLEDQLRVKRLKLHGLKSKPKPYAGNLPMPLPDYCRYGRQMILEGLGLPAQLKLRGSTVLVVGAGGLGCPAIQYLAAAGVGTIGILDFDKVELSNLQRQILHSDATIGMTKVESAKIAAQRIQPGIRVNTHTVLLTPSNAQNILQDYDVVLDCTDNLPTRYLLSDTAVLLGKSLVSGAAIRYDGQLCVYNLGNNGPCFRCIFPKPAAKNGEGSCAELGVLGVVTGVVGTLQALEAIRIIAGMHDNQAKLVLFSALAPTQFRTMKMRSRSAACPICSLDAPAKETFMQAQDYVAFCGGEAPDPVVTGSMVEDGRIGAQELEQRLNSVDSKPSLIDTRPSAEFSICSIPGSRNVPLKDLLKSPATFLAPDRSTVVLCRLGNDSQVAANALRQASSGNADIVDLVGGLRAWSETVDQSFPIY